MISLRCPHCQQTLRLAPELAGKSGACRFCGGVVTVPDRAALERAASALSLRQATPEQMIEELRRRGQEALLTLLGGTGEGDTIRALLENTGATNRHLRHFCTGDLSADDTHRLLALLGESHRDSQPTGEESEVSFSFKGDPLGMSLSDFRLKHERTVPGRRRRLPWCSDETPGADVPELMCEHWLASVGIVHARVDLPEENRSPTIAGAPTERVIYQFVDERLFQVTAFFSTDDFPKVSHTIQTKYGKPDNRTDQPLCLQWWSGDTTIELTQGRIHPKTPSIVRYFHDDLLAEAGTRKPDMTSDL